ncbi:MAG: winged helix-turn-helix domain-containing protein, partial [Anaerolineales bacterium]
VLRRWEEGTIDAGEPVEFGDLRLDPATREGFSGGNILQLTAKEFELLYFLMQNPGQVFKRDQLLDQVWGYDFHGDASTVTVHIRRLREKIEQNPSEPEKLLTVWGVGYRFVG